MLFGRDAHTPLDELAPALDDTDFGQGLERTPHGSPRSCRARLRRHPPDQYVHRATRSFCFDNMSPSSRIALLGCKSLLQKGRVTIVNRTSRGKARQKHSWNCADLAFWLRHSYTGVREERKTRNLGPAFCSERKSLASGTGNSRCKSCSTNRAHLWSPKRVCSLSPCVPIVVGFVSVVYKSQVSKHESSAFRPLGPRNLIIKPPVLCFFCYGGCFRMEDTICGG